jgi:hypothetical protein
VNASLLRALVGASDALRAAFVACADDPALRARIHEVGNDVAALIVAAVKDQGSPAEPVEVLS